VLVLDLDAHFGNGTAASFPNDPDLFLFDFHGHASDFWHPDTPHLFKSFRDESDARLYLQALRKELPRVLGEFRADTPRARWCSRAGAGRLWSTLADMPASKLWQHSI
jgi:acetoin utilization deacetylase AcuC-like enzyme